MTTNAGFLRGEIVVTALLTAFVLCVGVILGALLFVREGGKDLPSVGGTSPAEGAAEMPSPRLEGAAPAPDLPARLAAIEHTLADLRTSAARSQEQMRPLLDLYAKFQEEGIRPPVGEAVPIASERMATGDDARRVARDLGLDARRREDMATRYAEALAELEALEKQHASVSKEGDVTTIRIGRFPIEGGRVLRRWRDGIDRSLTPQEREAYERDHKESLLFGRRAGAFDRTVRIDETGGVIRVSESISTKEGEMEVLSLTSPSEGRDLALDSYRHILEPEPAK